MTVVPAPQGKALRPTLFIALWAAMIPDAFACAAEYLESVDSPVFEAKGSRAELSGRAASCLAQNSGIAGPSIQADPIGGTIVGPVQFPYSSGGVPWSVRSILTIEVKDGRFRMSQGGITQKQGGPAVSASSIFSGSTDQRAEGDWMRVGKWRFSGAEKVEAAAQALSQRIATCIQKPTKDW